MTLQNTNVIYSNKGWDCKYRLYNGQYVEFAIEKKAGQAGYICSNDISKQNVI